MNYSLAVNTEPAAEPLSLTETKLHLKVDGSDDDLLIGGLIAAAREWVENYCRRSLVQRTLELRMDGFPGMILLPRGPVSSVSSVKYTDAGGNLLTVDSAIYQTDLYSLPARIATWLGGVWPVPKVGAMNAVLVTYVAGYAPGASSPTDYAENVPDAIKAALKLLIGHWYENRQNVVVANVQAAEIPLAAKSLLSPFEIRDFCLE